MAELVLVRLLVNCPKNRPSLSQGAVWVCLPTGRAVGKDLVSLEGFGTQDSYDEVLTL